MESWIIIISGRNEVNGGGNVFIGLSVCLSVTLIAWFAVHTQTDRALNANS